MLVSALVYLLRSLRLALLFLYSLALTDLMHVDIPHPKKAYLSNWRPTCILLVGFKRYLFLIKTDYIQVLSLLLRQLK